MVGGGSGGGLTGGQAVQVDSAMEFVVEEERSSAAGGRREKRSRNGGKKGETEGNKKKKRIKKIVRTVSGNLEIGGVSKLEREERVLDKRNTRKMVVRSGSRSGRVEVVGVVVVGCLDVWLWVKMWVVVEVRVREQRG